MIEVSAEVVETIVKRIYDEVLKNNTPNQFIIMTYTHNDFYDIIDKKLFHTIMGFLPNTTHNGSPFIMSVSHNKFNDEYEVIVKNINN